MTADISEFPAMARAAEILDALDGHRQRQAFAFLAERYGWNLQPAAKKSTPAPNPDNRSEFAAIETAAEQLDELGPDQQRQAVALLAARYSWKVAASHKPPSKGFAPRRTFKRG
jgi:hypothetical protein